MASASTPKNRIVRTIALSAVFEDATALVTSSTSWNQGDLLVYDDSTYVIRTATSGGESSDSALFLGIAVNTVASGALVGPYTGLATTARTAIGYMAGPVYGVEAALPLANGDTLVPGNLVYMKPSVSPQTVSASGTKAIGVYNGPAITGDGTLTVNVRLGHRFPADTLVL